MGGHSSHPSPFPTTLPLLLLNTYLSGVTLCLVMSLVSSNNYYVSEANHNSVRFGLRTSRYPPVV